MDSLGGLGKLLRMPQEAQRRVTFAWVGALFRILVALSYFTSLGHDLDASCKPTDHDPKCLDPDLPKCFGNYPKAMWSLGDCMTILP